METKTIVLAGGCFWCTEAVFRELKGVLSVVSGYTGGDDTHPTYEKVCSGKTGHAECIRVEYDSSSIDFHDILTVFFATHDPTTLNRQGNDIGTQYRSAIFCHEEDRKEVDTYIENLKKEGVPVVTEVNILGVFYEAEEYHQDYYKRNKDYNPYCQVIIYPKVEKVYEKYSALLKKNTI